MKYVAASLAVTLYLGQLSEGEQKEEEEKFHREGERLICTRTQNVSFVGQNWEIFLQGIRLGTLHFMKSVTISLQQYH